jgi:hypothetical protein
MKQAALELSIVGGGVWSWSISSVALGVRPQWWDCPKTDQLTSLPGQSCSQGLSHIRVSRDSGAESPGFCEHAGLTACVSLSLETHRMLL